jgi:nucleoside-diphosphate-sugar epimerase
MGGGVAVIGAGGFVGARMIEMGIIEGRSDLVPVVRAARSLGRIAHLGVRHRMADASDRDALARAIAGCTAVVNLTKGEDDRIASTTRSIYEAAVTAGVRLIVHLSSAVVFGQVDRPDLPDDAAPAPVPWMPYAREKALAEDFLRERMADGRVATVVLRPSLIWGPSSPWVLGPGHDLVAGTAYLVGGGQGICDLLYVDNLVRSIEAVVTHPEPPPGFYNVGDDETTTWREYYAALAAGLGVDFATVHRVGGDRYRPGMHDHVAVVQKSRPYRWLKERISPDTRAAIKLRLARRSRSVRSPSGISAKPPQVTRELWNLQTTRYRLPTARFVETFGHHNHTTFRAGIAASLEWLRFIGLAAGDLEARPADAAALASAATR